MPSSKLKPKAIEDLKNIWCYTAEHWGNDQAIKYVDDLNSAFQRLAETPLICRLRDEYSPPIHIHSFAKHLIIYTTEDPGITIIRVLHKNMLPENHL